MPLQPARRRLTVLSVLLLLVLAGCTAPTVSLAETERPPGVRETRVVPEPLLASHTAALDDASYTVQFRYSGPNRTVTGSFRVGPGHERAAVDLRVQGPDTTQRTKVYVGDDYVYVRETQGSGTVEYRIDQRRNWTVRHLRNDLGMLAPALPALRQVSLEPTGTVGHGGRTLVVLEGTGTAAPPFHQYAPLDARLLVSERGVVHRADFESQRSNATSAWRLTRLGQTRVSRPLWVDEHFENRTTAENLR